MTSIFDMNQGVKFCQVCGEGHKQMQKCGHEALVRRVTRLLEANRLIPQLMQANKEAVTTAAEFQLLLKQADQAQMFIQEVLADYGDTGVEIYQKYLTKVDAWAQASTKPDTDDRQLHLDNVNTIQSDNENKPCTEETPIGDRTALDSSPLILSATPAENLPQS